MSFPFKKPYFIGIKGAGMIGLATLLNHEKIPVQGSDTSDIFFSDEILQSQNIPLHSFEEELPSDIDGIIYSAAYDENHPQRKKASQKNLKQLSYFEAIGKYSQDKETIAVIGTHGKTTTTALLGILLTAIGFDPTVLVGSQIKDFDNTTVRAGESDYFIVEACEYKNHFSHIKPNYILCTNIDYDHVDYFQTKEAYRETFLEYLKHVEVKNISAHHSCNLEKGTAYSQNDGNFSWKKIKQENQYQCFTVKIEDVDLEYFLPLLGNHMIDNAVGALALSWKLAKANNMSLESFYEKTKEALANFSGIKRRGESYGSYNGALLFDDYAHHPVEIETTLQGLKSAFPEKNITIIFQGHTFTRTQKLEKAFARSLKSTNTIYLAPIYGSAREKCEKYTDENFISCVKKENNNVFFGSFEQIVEKLSSSISEKDIVCTMGAGDVWKVVEALKQLA